MGTLNLLAKVRAYIDKRVEEFPDISMTILAEEVVEEFELDDSLLDEDSNWLLDMVYESVVWHEEHEEDEW